MKSRSSNFGRAGFSLVEVLLAVFILGIGLIMVATVFPVGAEWTKQGTENIVAQTIAQNAASVIQSEYDPNGGGTNKGKFSTLPAPTANTSKLQPIPNINNIPIVERCYQFGSKNPFPAANPTVCNYYWTALARQDPNQSLSAIRSYQVYIFVFRKGAAEQTFNTFPTGSSEFSAGTNYSRDNVNPTNNPPGFDYHMEPVLATGAFNAGVAVTRPPVTGAVPPVGFIGVGETSGTVFRQAVKFTPAAGTFAADPRPALMTAGENVIFGAPADGTIASPLIYVYQTTISF